MRAPVETRLTERQEGRSCGGMHQAQMLRGFRTSQHDKRDTMVFEIGEGGANRCVGIQAVEVNRRLKGLAGSPVGPGSREPVDGNCGGMPCRERLLQQDHSLKQSPVIITDAADAAITGLGC